MKFIKKIDLSETPTVNVVDDKTYAIYIVTYEGFSTEMVLELVDTKGTYKMNSIVSEVDPNYTIKRGEEITEIPPFRYIYFDSTDGTKRPLTEDEVSNLNFVLWVDPDYYGEKHYTYLCFYDHYFEYNGEKLYSFLYSFEYIDFYDD